MVDKFKNVPTDEDTKILLQSVKKLDRYEVLYQIWSWDGLRAESVIFLDDDVKNFSEEEIKKIVKTSLLVKNKKSRMTFSQSGSGYTFVNFNFDYD